MTHLDQLGSQSHLSTLAVFFTVTDCGSMLVAAGLSERDTDKLNVRTHGTDDIYDIAVGYNPSNPEQSARTLKNNWSAYNKDNQKKKPELARVENAESFAASATEFWFQSKCGWDTIEQ